MRAAQPGATRPGRLLTEHLTPAELRVLKLLPSSTYPQIAATLFVSCNRDSPAFIGRMRIGLNRGSGAADEEAVVDVQTAEVK